MKKYLILLFCALFLSCSGQSSSEKNSNGSLTWEEAEYYALKYEHQIKTFRKLLFEQYFNKININELKACDSCLKDNPLMYPANFKENIDSLVAHNIPFSEQILHVSIIYYRKTMPEEIIWCSEMNNYCKHERMFGNNLMDSGGIPGGGGGLMKSWYSVIFQDDIKNGGKVVVFIAEEFFDEYPILLIIALKKDITAPMKNVKTIK